MFELKPKVVQIRLLTMLVGVDAERGPWSADRGTVVEWDAGDAKRLIAGGYAKLASDPQDVPASPLPRA